MKLLVPGLGLAALGSIFLLKKKEPKEEESSIVFDLPGFKGEVTSPQEAVTQAIVSQDKEVMFSTASALREQGYIEQAESLETVANEAF